MLPYCNVGVKSLEQDYVVCEVKIFCHLVLYRRCLSVPKSVTLVYNKVTNRRDFKTACKTVALHYSWGNRNKLTPEMELMTNLERTTMAGSVDVGFMWGKKTQRHLKNEFSLSPLQGSLASKDWTTFPHPGHLYLSLYLHFSQLISICSKLPD